VGGVRTVELVIEVANLSKRYGSTVAVWDLAFTVLPRTDLSDGSLYLGPMRGNVGDQTYELPGDLSLAEGAWTVLVWCEAFVAATVTVS